MFVNFNVAVNFDSVGGFLYVLSPRKKLFMIAVPFRTLFIFFNVYPYIVPIIVPI